MEENINKPQIEQCNLHIVSGSDCKECKNCLYYNVVKLGCKHPNWDSCIKRNKSGVVIDYLYHEYHYR